MGFEKRMERSFRRAPVLPLDQNSKYVLFSDCHRGSGRANDNFIKNEFLYLAALEYYLRGGYTYVEVGDGEELWENCSMEKIKEAHPHSYSMLASFYCRTRLFLLYGNHDMVKRKKHFGEKNYGDYFCHDRLCQQPLCPQVEFHEGLILRDCQGGRDIYVTHGHQASMMNSSLWRVNRFLVRVLWKNLELLGVPDPTSVAKNNTRKEAAEKRLARWARERDVILIAGHTHRPMAGTADFPYFNTGSCVHPAGITGIEIQGRCISVVKWWLGTREDRTAYVRRDILGERMCIDGERTAP